MHWYTWALTLWAILSGVPALAVLCVLLPIVVAGRRRDSTRARAAELPVTPAPSTTAQTLGLAAKLHRLSRHRTSALVTPPTRETGSPLSPAS
jgi:hypothetical protein